VNLYGRYDSYASFKPYLREVFWELEENLIYDLDKNHSVRLSNWYKRTLLLRYNYKLESNRSSKKVTKSRASMKTSKKKEKDQENAR